VIGLAGIRTPRTVRDLDDLRALPCLLAIGPWNLMALANVMSAMARVAGYALMAVLTSCGGCSSDRASPMGHRAPRPPLPSNLAAANVCESAADCFDMGRICPYACHVPVNTSSPKLMDVADAMWASLRAEHEGECTIDCSAPLYGFECVERRCVARSRPPSRPICFGIDGGETDCRELLTRRKLWSKCRDFCDGASPPWEWGGRRLQPLVRIPRDDGWHDSASEKVDFFPCALCEGGRSEAEPRP
jgi:hypothetical protein